MKKTFNILYIVFPLIVFALPANAEAEVRYIIKNSAVEAPRDEDMLLSIRQKAELLVASGEWNAILQRATQNAIAFSKEPQGKLFATAPEHFIHISRINATEKAPASLKKELSNFERLYLFVDGSRSSDVVFAKRFISSCALSAFYEFRIVMTNGNVPALASMLNTNVYFDQSAQLTKKFDIQHIPAVVHLNSERAVIFEPALNTVGDVAQAPVINKRLSNEGVFSNVLKKLELLQ